MVKRKRNTSIITTLAVPLVIYLILQMAVIFVVFFFGGVFGKVNKNIYDLFDEKVSGRSKYVQTDMTERWSDVKNLTSRLNALYAEASASNATGIESKEDVFFKSAFDDIVDTIRNNAVTGAFVITRERTSVAGQYHGLYLHCSTPDSVTSDTVFVNVASRGVADFLAQKGYSTESRFKNYFSLGERDIFYFNPFNAAGKEPHVDAVNYGYWSDPFSVIEDGPQVITYTRPLVLNGDVYGVVGVDLALDYIKKFIPYSELYSRNDAYGSYILAKEKSEGVYSVIAKSGLDFPYFFGANATQAVFKTLKSGFMECKGYDRNGKGVAKAAPLKLYNNNTPFENDRWVLIGLMSKDVLLADYNNMIYLVSIALTICTAAGLIIIIFVARVISAPVTKLERQVSLPSSQPSLKLDKTQIKEIDKLIDSIESLSLNVAQNASKMSKIIEMTGFPLGAFEIDDVTQQVNFTDKFLNIIGRRDLKNEPIDSKMMHAVLDEMKSRALEDAEDTYTYIDEAGIQHWVALKTVNTGSAQTIGVAQDITEETIKKNKIEYERDFDILTGLLNRRAFLFRANKLFENSFIGNAALIMMDLDNLKIINDTYGHGYGDEYIRTLSRSIKGFIPEAEYLTARMSGDEFLVLLYGYRTELELKDDIIKLKNFIMNSEMNLPQNRRIKTRLSGGYAFYPNDTKNLEDLVLYADYAMYEVKRSTKGDFNAFNLSKYKNREYRVDTYEKLDNLIAKNLVEYKYQPIVNFRTGKVFAYEALMRSLEPSLPDVRDVLTAARDQHKLGQIEKLTFFNALSGYQKFKSDFEGARIFINSIPSQIMSDDDIAQMQLQFSDILDRMVVEFTEDEKLNEDMAKVKCELVSNWKGKIAVDDYGSGYSNDIILLVLSPNFIKVDIFIIKGIDKDKGKQKLLENIVAYASERKIKVIAEGVETAEEMQTLAKLNVDYLQGFYLGVPTCVPCGITAKKRREVEECYYKEHPFKINSSEIDD